MGQYYNPCIITVDKNGKVSVVNWVSSFSYGNGCKQMEHSYIGNNFVEAFEWLISPEGPHHKAQVVWAGDYGATEDGYETNLFGLCEDEKALAPTKSGASYPLVVNHSKKCFFDKREVEEGPDGTWKIHPLPLLTMETDSGGGGDYRGINEHLLGTLARDVISVEKVAPVGFEKLVFEFCE